MPAALVVRAHALVDLPIQTVPRRLVLAVAAATIYTIATVEQTRGVGPAATGPVVAAVLILFAAKDIRPCAVLRDGPSALAAWAVQLFRSEPPRRAHRHKTHQHDRPH